jgi:hypothetical protein
VPAEDLPLVEARMRKMQLPDDATAGDVMIAAPELGRKYIRYTGSWVRYEMEPRQMTWKSDSPRIDDIANVANVGLLMYTGHVGAKHMKIPKAGPLGNGTGFVTANSYAFINFYPVDDKLPWMVPGSMEPRNIKGFKERMAVIPSTHTKTSYFIKQFESVAKTLQTSIRRCGITQH